MVVTLTDIKSTHVYAGKLSGGSLNHIADKDEMKVIGSYFSSKTLCNGKELFLYGSWLASHHEFANAGAVTRPCNRCVTKHRKLSSMTGTTTKTQGVNVNMKGIQSEWYTCITETVKSPACNRFLLYGPPGTGKTSIAFYEGREGGNKVYSITVNEDTSAQEVLGHFVVKGGSTVWHDGPAMRAWKEGAWFVVNEIGEASGPVMTALYAICDDPNIAEIMLPSGEIVKPKNGFKFFATTNEQPDSLPEALLDRFDVKVLADIPSPKAIAALPTSVQKIVSTSYASARAGSNSAVVTYRSAQAFGKMVDAGIDTGMAAKVVFGPTRGKEFLRDWTLINAAPSSGSN